MLPDSSYELVCVQQSRYVVDGKPLPGQFFVGQLKKPADFYANGSVKQWAVRFYPWGLQPFGDVSKIAHKTWVPADEVMNGDEAGRLVSILDGGKESEIPALLDDYFIRQLLGWQFDDRLLMHAFNELKKQNGKIKVKDLADFCFISQRQLDRKVSHATGQSPHEIASRLRFEQVRDAIMHNPDIPLTFLAHDYGYTDQSHLVKEFRSYMNMTPSDYISLTREHQPRMQDPQNVLFLQLHEDEIV